MALLYSCIARGTRRSRPRAATDPAGDVVLAEKLKSEDTQLKDISRQLLAKVPKDNHKKSYTYDRYAGCFGVPLMPSR